MWTAILVQTSRRSDGQNQATVRFVSDNPQFSTITMTNFGDNFGGKELNNWVYIKLQSLNSGDLAYSGLKQIPEGLIEPTQPDSPITP